MNLEREKLLKEVHLAKEKLALMEKDTEKEHVKESLDLTDISDDFSPGSIIPQRLKGLKRPCNSITLQTEGGTRMSDGTLLWLMKL